MGRFVKCAKLMLLASVVCIVVGRPAVVSAVSDKIWTGTTIVGVGEGAETALPYGRTSCPADVFLVSIEGWSELREACVYGGDGMPQVARYAGSTGSYLYAIKFPLDTKFITIRDMCLGAARCVYGQAEDVLIMQVQQQFGPSAALIEDFTKHLKRFTDDGTYFRFENSGSPNYISLGSRIAKTNAVAVSPNGQWAVVELEGFGFVRVNLKTLEYKRVIAPGAQYGYGTDPSFEMAITNDGTKIAIVGWRASVWVYEVNNECGDTLTDASSLYFSPYVYACEAATIDVYNLFPGFIAAYIPRFSNNGTHLGVYVQQGQKIYKATIAPPAFKTTTNPEHTYIAFGDSFTSGEGELSDMFYLPTTNTSENHCHVSTRSYPYLIGMAWDDSTINRACSGSLIADVREASRQVAAMLPDESPRYVSIGVGGNDIDLMGKLKTCLGPGTCEWASVEKRRATLDEVKAIFPRVVKLIGDIADDYPGVTVALVGYPSPINTSSTASCSLMVSSLLNSEERRYMDESVRYLNRVMKAAANYAGVSYIDIEDALSGERLCDASDRAMNSVRLGDDIAPISLLGSLKVIGAESFHPTPRGHQMISAAIQESTGGRWWSGARCGDCQYNESQLAPSVYWYGDANEAAPIKQRAEPFLSATDVASGARVSFSFPSGSFLPGSTVAFEFHSTPQKLAEYRATDDGSLAGEVTLPDDSGYHTVHALGWSFSGEAADVYQTIAVGTPSEAGAGASDMPTPTGLGPIDTTNGTEPKLVFDNESPQSVISSVKGFSIQNPFVVAADAAPIVKAALAEVPRDFIKTIKVFSIGVIGGGIVASVALVMVRKWKTRRRG